MSVHRRIRSLPRGVAALPLLAAALAGCGGGSPVADAPAVHHFAADRAAYFVGETARLTVSYTGGHGRIEPGIGAVPNDATVATPPLETNATYRLIVDSPKGSASRELTLQVRHRDRYVELPAPFVASRHQAVLAGDGTVLLIGGSRGEGVLSARIDRFDPATRTLMRAGELLVGREAHTATRLPDGRILVAGGLTSLPQPRQIELIDERTGASKAAGELAANRIGHSATLLADGRVLIAGGYGGGASRALDSAELWNPATRSARLLPARMHTARAAHSATLLDNGRVLLVGGFNALSEGYVLAEVFDPRTERFSPVATTHNLLRLLHVAHRMADGSVLIAGGETWDTASQNTTPLASVLRFYPALDALEPLPSLGAPRTAVASVAAPDGRILLFGGLGAGDEQTASAESYAAADGAWPLAQMPSARAWHTVTRLRDGRVLIAGGEDATRAYVRTMLLYE